VDLRFWLRLAFLVYALGIFAYRDSLMDDTFIHLQYARNLRLHGELAFNRGEPSMGATSPFWVLWLAATGATPLAARLASVGFGALAVWLFALQARRLLGGAFATAASLAWAGNLWLIRHAPNGMESTAAVFFVLLALHVHRRPVGWARDAALGLAAAAACLVRPELGLFVVCLVVADGRRFGARTWKSLRWLLIFPLPLALWAWFAWSQTGALLPGTAAAKSAGPGFHAALAVLWRQGRMLTAAHPVEGLGLLALLLLQLRMEGWRSLRRLTGHPWPLFAAFVILLVGSYAVMDVQVQPRYLLPALPFITLAGFAAWRTLLGSTLRGAAVLAVLALLVSATVSAVRVLPVTRSYGRALLPALRPLVDTMQARPHGNGGVATPDIGVIGYYGNLRVVDLGGLIDPALRELRHRVGDDSLLTSGAFLSAGNVDFVVDRDAKPQRFAGMRTEGRRWMPLCTTRIPNLGLSRPGPFYYTLYALEP
jgi:hypothetical protein